MDLPPSLAELLCPSPLARFHLECLGQKMPITFRAVNHQSSDSFAKEVESFRPFDVCNAFDIRTLSCLLKLDFIHEEDLVLEDRVALNQYRNSPDSKRTWFLRGQYNPTPQDKAHWKFAYDRYWEIKLRSWVDNDQSPIMIYIPTGKRVSIQRRMKPCDGISRSTIRKYRLFEINTQTKRMKTPRMFARDSYEEYLHDVATETLRARGKPSRGRSRCGSDFFEWKRGVWTPGGSPLRRPPLVGGANENEESDCHGGPARSLSNRQSIRWHPYAA